LIYAELAFLTFISEEFDLADALHAFLHLEEHVVLETTADYELDTLK